MANPNSTVANWRNQKWHVVVEFRFRKSYERDAKAAELRAEYAGRPNFRVRTAQHKSGSNPSATNNWTPTPYCYTVRVYEGPGQ